MNNKSNPFLLVTALMVSVPFLVTKSVQAEIFKCEDVEGKVFYNDKPCSLNDKETKMNSVKDPVNGYVPVPLESYTEAKQNQKTMDKDSVTAGSVDTEKNPEEFTPPPGEVNKNSAESGGSSVSDAAKADTPTDYSNRKYMY